MIIILHPWLSENNISESFVPDQFIGALRSVDTVSQQGKGSRLLSDQIEAKKRGRGALVHT